MKILTRIVLAAALACSAACAGPKAGDVVIKPWSLRTPSGGKIECERGTLYVPENRSNPKSRVIGIGFLRIKALRETGAPPTIHLPGGPARSFLEMLHANEPNETARIIHEGFDDDFAFYRNISDMIFFDQRGYSRLGDMLTFPYQTKPLPLGEETSVSQHAKEFVDVAKRAIAHYQKEGFDLSGYNIKECAADVNDLCRALRYRQVTLIGNSFGGQWAFATIRLFPEIVSRALISSVEPLGCGYDIPSEVYRAMKRRWESVGPDKRLPADGFDGAVRQILRELPVSVTLDANTANSKIIRLGRDDFYYCLMGFEADDIFRIYQRDYEKWARLAVSFRENPEDPLDLIGPLIDVSLGVSAERRRKILADPALEMVGRWDFEDYFASEGIWPAKDVGDEFRAEIETKTPVVFVQGEWDMQTPMENMKLVRDYFKNSRTVIVTNGLHDTAYARARRQVRAVKIGVAEFLVTGSMAKLPATVTLPTCEGSASPPNPPVIEKYRYAR